MEINIYISGVGGQGAIRLGQIIADYALQKSKKIKLFKEVGMAQRGGAVHCEIRIGNVFGSRIPPYSSDATVVMELSEGLKALEFVKPGGTVILNNHKVYPIDLMAQPEKYPEFQEIEALFKKTKAKIIWIDAKKIAKEIGLPVAENMVLLGTLSQILSFDKRVILGTLEKNIPCEIEKNLYAFQEGYRITKGIKK